MLDKSQCKNNIYIDFNEIKQYVNVKDEKLFLLYLREVFKDLADRDESNKKKGIMKMIFFDYIKLEILNTFELKIVLFYYCFFLYFGFL